MKDGLAALEPIVDHAVAVLRGGRLDHDAPARGPRMKVLLTLQDVEPAVRLNGILEREGVDTAVVSPLDDIRGTLRREKPISSSSAAISRTRPRSRS